MTRKDADRIDLLLVRVIVEPGAYRSINQIASAALDKNDPDGDYDLTVRLAALDYFRGRAAELVAEPAALAAVVERLDATDDDDLSAALVAAVAARARRGDC